MPKWLFYVLTLGGLITVILVLFEDSKYRKVVKRILSQIKAVEKQIEKEKEEVADLDNQRSKLADEEKQRRVEHKKKLKDLKETHKNKVKKIKEGSSKARKDLDTAIKENDTEKADKILEETLDTIKNL
jgi:hypothetical protein